MRKRARRKVSQERGPQQNPGRHLAYHARLADMLKRDAEEARGGEHHTNLQKK
jgi:hypothetical protein